MRRETLSLDLDLLRAQRCVAIIRATSVNHLAKVAHALVAGGIRILEFPLTTPGLGTALSSLVEELSADACVGAGTVTTVEDARACRDAGAQFLVTPNLDLRVLDFARTTNLPTLVGALSPTEIFTAWNAGATAVKLFPGSLGGPGYVRELRSPYPNIPLVPTGGIKVADIPAFLDAGAVALGIASDLVGTAAETGPDDALHERVRRLRSSTNR